MLQRHKLKVDRLHRRPKHPILLQRLRIRPPQPLLRIRTLHPRHTGEEGCEVARCEDGLVGEDAGGDGEVGAGGEVDAAREEGEPGCCCGAEDAYGEGGLTGGWWEKL